MIGGIRKTELSDKLIKEIDGKVDVNDLTPLQEEIKGQKANIMSLNKIKKNITISTTEWTLDSATNLYKYKIEDVDITTDTIVDVNIKLSDLEKASDFKSANESFLGYVEIYSESVPEENILCDLKLVKQMAVV